MEYRTDVFESPVIDVLIERLRKVLVAVAAAPERTVSSMCAGWDRACPVG